MIVAKTSLKKLPQTCKGCKFKASEYLGFENSKCVLAGNYCPTDKSEHNNLKYAPRPNWCPLKEEK